MKQFFYDNIDVFFSYIRFVNPIFGIRRTFLGKGICQTVLSLLMPLSFKYSIQNTIWKTIIEFFNTMFKSDTAVDQNIYFQK